MQGCRFESVYNQRILRSTDPILILGEGEMVAGEEVQYLILTTFHDDIRILTAGSHISFTFVQMSNQCLFPPFVKHLATFIHRMTIQHVSIPRSIHFIFILFPFSI